MPATPWPAGQPFAADWLLSCEQRSLSCYVGCMHLPNCHPIHRALRLDELHYSGAISVQTPAKTFTYENQRETDQIALIKWNTKFFLHPHCTENKIKKYNNKHRHANRAKLRTNSFCEHSTGERRAMKMASRTPRWLAFLAFARMVKHFNRFGQTLSLDSVDSFRCLVMSLQDLRISRAQSSEASSSELTSSDVVLFSAAPLDWLLSTMMCLVSNQADGHMLSYNYAFFQPLWSLPT